MDIDASLKNSELFSGLSDSRRREIADSGKEISLLKGNTLFREGEKGISIYLLLEGSVKLFRNAEDGREIIVRILSGGELFGEVVLYLDENYPVSAETLSDSRLLTIPKNTFYGLMEAEEFRNEFIALLMNKQRYLSARIHYLSAFDVEERFFQFLRDNYGTSERYSIEFSKKDLAAAIGTIPETLSRLIARLKRRGIMTWEKKYITLKENFWEDFD